MHESRVKKKPPAKNATADRALPAQHRFLAEMASARQTVAVFLANGLKLQGRIASFDEYSILLEGEKTDIVYKHAISTIQPLTDVAASAGVGARHGVPGAAAEDAGDAKPRMPRQPTIVVRTRRRSIKGPADNS